MNQSILPLLLALTITSTVQLAAAGDANTLSAKEKAAGWQLLFNGKDLSGWHNFKKEGVRPGWQVKDGALICVDPHNAGDIVTSNQFGWFELQLDYNITEAGNSGIMYHVTDEGNAAWATGPEFQLEDNVKAADKQRCVWLYGLYQPPVDPKTVCEAPPPHPPPLHRGRRPGAPDGRTRHRALQQPAHLPLRRRRGGLRHPARALVVTHT